MEIGDTVILITPKEYNDGIKIPAGARGTVQRVVQYVGWVGCYVTFFGFGRIRLVSTSDLKKS